MANNRSGQQSSPVIAQPEIMSLALEVEGESLIQNCFSQKSIEEMLRKHMGLSVQREKKVPAECVERAIIRNTEGAICIPSTAFKQAMLTAAGQVKGLKKTNLRVAVFIEGNSIPITFSRMVPRMDFVRTAGVGSNPDVRFRPQFEDWRARLIITFPDSLPAQTVVDLLNRAGSVGVGEWRPEKDGTHGTFTVTRNITDSKEISEIRKACRPTVKQLTIPDWAMNAEISPDILKRISDSEPNETGDSGENARADG